MGRAGRFNLPVRYHTEVTSVEERGPRYLIRTKSVSLLADNVVVATGVFQRDKVPAFARNIPAHVLQVHSSAYRSPEKLPPGAVLVAEIWSIPSLLAPCYRGTALRHVGHVPR
jgi:putative flavoprotein involved in K+ transport